MPHMRCYAIDAGSGVPIAAIIADQDDPGNHSVAGGRSAKGMVSSRWRRYTGNYGKPRDLDTLMTTLSGSYTRITPWEPVDQPVAALDEAERIIAAGQRRTARVIDQFPLIFGRLARLQGK